MANLYVTDNAQGHDHVVYVSDATQMGRTSIDEGHEHEVVFDPAAQTWVVGFGPDGHGHVLQDLSTKTWKSPKEEDAEILSDVYRIADEWIKADEENRNLARESERFAWGEQWDKGIKEELESKGRAALVINSIERMIDALCGEQRQERTDIYYYPQEGGDQRVADILNHLVKHLLESCFFGREESKAFEDAVICGRGLLNVYVDFSRNIQGEIKVERFPWEDVVFGPHEKEDLEDCDGLVKHKMYSKARLKSIYPEFAKKIDEVMATKEMFKSPNSLGGGINTVYKNDDYEHGTEIFPNIVGEYGTVDIVKKELRVFELWRKVYERLFVIANPDENFYLPIEGMRKGLANRFRGIPGLYVIEREKIKFRVTRVVGDLILSDEYPAELPTDDFFIVPVYARKRGDKWKGKVASGIDSQKELNRRHSQAIDIGNQAGYGWFYDDTTFADRVSEREFVENVSAPNFKLKIADLRNPPVRQEGVKFPSEIVQLLQLSDQALTTTLSMEVGQGGANESTSHFMERKNARLLPNEFLFDNLAFAKKKLGKLLVPIIQRYYTPDRILRILQTTAMRQENTQVGGQPLQSYDPNEIIAFLETADLSLYDVEVSESAYSPTKRMATLMLLTEMVRGGMAVDPALLIEFMDLPADIKARVQSSMAQQAASAQEGQQATADMEIQKTLIAQGAIPPAVQQKYLTAPPPAEAQVAPQEGMGAPPGSEQML